MGKVFRFHHLRYCCLLHHLRKYLLCLLCPLHPARRCPLYSLYHRLHHPLFPALPLQEAADKDLLHHTIHRCLCCMEHRLPFFPDLQDQCRNGNDNFLLHPARLQSPDPFPHLYGCRYKVYCILCLLIQHRSEQNLRPRLPFLTGSAGILHSAVSPVLYLLSV